MMKLSIVHPVLNSHEIVRRQVLHYKRMDLPDDIEIIIVDDDSDPPLRTIDMPAVSNIRIIETHDPRPWTWAIASNTGIKAAKGEYILRADIDYIIPRAAIEDALNLKEDRMNFRREFGILDANGMFFNDLDTLRKYGLSEKRIRDKGRKVSAHTNDFVMRRSVFLDVLGGYRTDLIGKPYPQGEDRCFQGVWERAQSAGKVNRTEYRPLVYMFPNGKFCGKCDDLDADPMGFFHTLSRKN